jgi:NAD(P)H dehydrogenase (quinone)
MPIIAIAGGTGTVGSKLTRQLIESGARVRVLSRNPEKARTLFGANVDAVGIDFDNAKSMRQAFEGADKAFLSTATSARQVRDEKALIDAAVDAGVPYLVGLSVGGAGASIASNVLEWHTEIDAHLANKNVAWTLLRPATFTDTLVRVASGFVPKGVWGGAAGDGQISAIDTRDVAACAAAVLLEGAERHGHEIYDLTGPAPVTMDGIAALLAEGLGRPVTYIRRTEQAQRAFYAAVGLPPLTIDVLLGLDHLTRTNVYATPTPGVMALTCQVPRSVAAFVQERIADFAMPAKT